MVKYRYKENKMTDILFSNHAAHMLAQKKSEAGECTRNIFAFETDMATGDITGYDENFNGFGNNERSSLNREAISALRRIKETNGTVKIWLCPPDPEELLSLMYICYALQDTQCRIFCVLLPSWHMNPAYSVRMNSSEDTNTDVMDDDFTKTICLSDKAIRHLASEFIRIRNSPETLRINFNGKIICLPEDFFDQIIMSELHEKPAHGAKIIGKIRTRIPALKIPFIYERLMYLAENGLIGYTDREGTEFFSLAE